MTKHFQQGNNLRAFVDCRRLPCERRTLPGQSTRAFFYWSKCDNQTNVSFGVSTETVSRKVEMYPDRVKNGRPTNLIQPEALCVMSELRKKNFVEPLQNDKVITRSELAEFGTAIVSEVIKQLMPMILASSGHPATLAIESKQTPKLAPRDELRMIVNKAAKESGDYSGTWKTLYTEIYYRLHINAQERAKNAKTSAIDILEAEGLLESAVLIAREIFK